MHGIPQADIKQSSSNDLNMDNFAEEDEINAEEEESKAEVRNFGQVLMVDTYFQR